MTSPILNVLSLHPQALPNPILEEYSAQGVQALVRRGEPDKEESRHTAKLESVATTGQQRSHSGSSTTVLTTTISIKSTALYDSTDDIKDKATNCRD